MSAWQYQILRFENAINHPQDVAAILDAYGKDGWELVAVVIQFTTHVAYLKRPRP